ncbi:hypothetical protein [uncultured Actinomyces sp.]|uniref:hypothetical protein n=1 Tax=uncultured Actinomyces sp. TaxID=249061 RepID=UPI0028D85C4F|nr:hypothetical protein [uncultured Actinomyces sp.]
MLTWLPTEAARRSKALQSVHEDGCVTCAAGDAQPDAVVVPFPERPEPRRRGVPAPGQAVLDELIEAGQEWIEVTSEAVSLLVEYVPEETRVDVVPGAMAVVAGPGPIVRSWGQVGCEGGGRVAAGAGSMTVLAGGTAAVCDGGTLRALAGTGVVDAGARLVLNTEDDEVDQGLVVYALPWSVVVVDDSAEVVTSQPWGVIVDADGRMHPAPAEPPVAAGEILEAAQAMGAHPGL